jgi:competence protein ComEA
LLVLGLVILGFRWSVLAARVPLEQADSELTMRAVPAEASEPAGRSAPAAKRASTSRGDVTKLDLNQATKSQLVELPGIGPVLAGRILDYREEQGAFASVDELLDVEGIGECKLEAVRELICAKPVD